MAKKIKRKQAKSSIKVEQMLVLLRQVNLGGVIDECTLTIEEGLGFVEVVDITNSLIVIAERQVASKDVNAELGLGNLDLLISFFGSLSDQKVVMAYEEDDDFCVFKRKDSRRKLNYLLTQTDLIATNLSLEEDEDDDSEAEDKLKELMRYEVELTTSVIKDFLKYIGMISNKEVTLAFDGDEELRFHLGGKNDHRFELAMREEVTLVDEDEEGDGECELKINGEHLAKVLNAINYDEDNPPSMCFADGETPMMVTYKGITWCLNPLTDFEEGE